MIRIRQTRNVRQPFKLNSFINELEFKEQKTRLPRLVKKKIQIQ